MDFDEQLRRYFGTSDMAAVPPAAREAGIEHMRVDLGLASEPAQRFVLWALLYTLGSAPDLEVSFKDESEREAARNLMDLLGAAEQGE